VAGAGLTALSVGVALLGETFWHFAIGLAILGVGWNFMFVGATSLLATAYAPHERVRAQAANDFIVFGTVTEGQKPTFCTHAGHEKLTISGIKIGKSGLNIRSRPILEKVRSLNGNTLLLAGNDTGADKGVGVFGLVRFNHLAAGISITHKLAPLMG
jgi:hypothetical protein